MASSEMALEQLKLSDDGDVYSLDSGFQVGRDGSLIYHPRFTTSANSTILFRSLMEEVGPLLRYTAVPVKGSSFCVPRMQAAFGDPGVDFNYPNESLQVCNWTKTLAELKHVLSGGLNQLFNLALVNFYKPRQCYLGEHKDAEHQMVPGAPMVCLSLGGDRTFQLKQGLGPLKDEVGGGGGGEEEEEEEETKEGCNSIVLENGSLLVMNTISNSDWYHSVPVKSESKHSRCSVTFRVCSLRKKQVAFQQSVSENSREHF